MNKALKFLKWFLLLILGLVVACVIFIVLIFVAADKPKVALDFNADGAIDSLDVQEYVKWHDEYGKHLWMYNDTLDNDGMGDTIQ